MTSAQSVMYDVPFSPNALDAPFVRTQITIVQTSNPKHNHMLEEEGASSE